MPLALQDALGLDRGASLPSLVGAFLLATSQVLLLPLDSETEVEGNKNRGVGECACVCVCPRAFQG